MVSVLQNLTLWCFSFLHQEHLRLDACLFENGSKRAFRHIAGMSGNGGVKDNRMNLQLA
jgi:hypothetical protein